MVDPEFITETLTSERVDFVPQVDAAIDRWVVFCSIGVITIELSESRECLRIRTGPIADLNGLTEVERNDLYRRSMIANDRISVGRYCGTDTIDFEVGMIFPGNSLLSKEQLLLGIRVVASVGCFGLRAMYQEL